MKAHGHGHAGATEKYLNPPFDPRILRIGAPGRGAKKLKRGRLVNAIKDANTGRKHGVNFLYNPVAVSASHNLSMDVVTTPGMQQSTSASTQMGQLPNIGSVSVDLLYDRTYELWDRSKQHTLAGRFGMYADVLAFYYLLGITDKGASYGGNAATADAGMGSVGVAWQSLYPTSYIDPTNRMYLYIGDKMRFYGTVTDLSITYSHWNEKMIPMRGQISIAMSFQTDAASAKTVKVQGTNQPTSQQPHRRPRHDLPGGR